MLDLLGIMYLDEKKEGVEQSIEVSLREIGQQRPIDELRLGKESKQTSQELYEVTF